VIRYCASDKIPSGRASIKVTPKTSGKKIMVERDMDWNSRGAGTYAIGHSDCLQTRCKQNRTIPDDTGRHELHRT